MAPKTKTITCCNTISNIDVNIVKRKDTIQEELFNYEDENDACKMFLKDSKRIQQTKRSKRMKRRKILLVADKGNASYCFTYKFHIL